MKNLLLLLLLLLPLMCFSQENEPSEESKDGWEKSGKITLLINQSAFSNWQAGGDNNFAGNLNLNYDLNYLSGDWSLDNKILASYGLTNSKDDGIRKTVDRLELNSILGKKLKESWSASFFMNFKTHFTDGYDYEDDFIDQNPTLSNEDRNLD